jgi:hypothetical protein
MVKVKFTYHLHVPMSRNLGALTSWNPVGLFRPVMGQLLKVKVTLEQTTKTQRGSRGIALLFL